MKSFLAIPLFAAAVLANAEPSWDFTFTFTEGGRTWTSATSATVNPTVAPAPAVSASSWTGPGEWTSYTSYTATYSSGGSTWGVPTAVSYSIGEHYTSMIPATTAQPASSVKPTTAAPAASTFTGAANINGKMAGVGAVAMAGLALVL